jgi:uncharacterized damage-inducible protein DinB
MDVLAYFRMLARYNRIANETIFENVSSLEHAEYFKQRPGSFGSIHGLLNHLMLGDQIWMERFQGSGHDTPKLNTALFDHFSALKPARVELDARIERFFMSLTDEFLQRSFPYINNKGIAYVETAPVAVGHFFNHQTHHRGQVHVMLSQTSVPPPPLDLHRIMNP